MKPAYVLAALASVLALVAFVPTTAAESPEWAMNATVIEACSCPMFCQCYFNTKPAAHHAAGEHEANHFCRFNNVYRINRGHYGATKLDGAKFWIAGDLGGDFSHGEMDWALVYFDRAMGQEQRDGVAAMLPHLFPVKWRSLTTAEGSIDRWEFTNDWAHTTLDGGRTAEVKLRRTPGMTDAPVVIHNLRYWGAPRNDGFIMMPNEVEAHRVGDKAFEFRGTNGFMLTLDMNSKDFEKAGATAP